MGMAAILAMWPGLFLTNFCSRVIRSLHMKFEFDWPSGLRGEDVWKCWRTDDGRTDDRVTGILLAHPWAFGSGELKIKSRSPNLNLVKIQSLVQKIMYGNETKQTLDRIRIRTKMPPSICNKKTLLFNINSYYKFEEIGKKMPKIESENKFLTSINGYNSVLICQIYPSAIPGHSFPISTLIESLEKIG